MRTYISDSFVAALQHHQLATFSEVWAKDIEWFEAPNHRRGGWSGVGKISLPCSDGKLLHLFVKKQQDHGRRTLLHPIKGEPTFRREFERLEFLAQHQVACPKVVMFAERIESGHQQSILITESLEDFLPLDSLLGSWWQTSHAETRQALLQHVADALRRFHDLGLMHRALYPKHIFVKNPGLGATVALIDLEKARFNWLAWYRTYFDLAALNRHTEILSENQRHTFFLMYMKQSTAGVLTKLFCRLIYRRSQR
jgi:hypothetical protein